MIGNLNKEKGRGSQKNCPFFYGLLLILFYIYIMSQFALIGLCWAESRYADPNTGIQTLIDEASYGDTVFVKKGIYEEGVIFMNEGVSLIGMEEDFGSVIISGDPDGAAILPESHTTIANLVIRDARIGIFCLPAEMTDITMEHNLIIKNKIGITTGANHVHIINNTIVENTERGILIFVHPNDFVFRGEENIIAFNGPNGGIEFVQQDDPGAELSGFLDLKPFIVLRYNLFYDTLYQEWLDSDGYHKDRIPITSPSPFGPGNFSGDPYFVDTNQEDYHLLSFSPCIDAGDPNSEYSLEPSPNGERINLGFYGNTPQAVSSIDSDGDGPYDFQEGTGDMDNDGIPDWQDGDISILPLPWLTDKIAILLQDSDPNQKIQFKNTEGVPASELSIASPQGVIPFDAIGFSITGLDEGEGISVKMVFPKNFKSLEASQYLALSSDTAPSSEATWEPLSFETEENSNAITFFIQDGQSEDRDGIENGVIEHLAVLVIPHSITWKNLDTCFVCMLDSFHRDHAGFGPKDYIKGETNPGAVKYEGYILLGLLGLLSILSLLGLLSILSISGISCISCISCISGISGISGISWISGISCISGISNILCLFRGSFLTGCLIRKGSLIKKGLPVLFICSMLLPLFFSLGWAQIKEDIEITSSPNPVGSGARALGMGGAFIAVADDATAASWNPAGIKHLGKPEVSWVQAYSSRKEGYRFEQSPESSGDYCLSKWDVNYLSMAFPLRIFQQNLFVSLNYQYLYDFSRALSYSWRSFSDDPNLDIHDIRYQASYEQSGGLKALSPAMAFSITPRLTFGLTVNIWSDELFNNQWIEKYHKDGHGEIDVDHKSVVTHVDVLERYGFSGLNFHLGMLWDITDRFTLGLVYKTPFKADLDHTTTYYKIEEYPNLPSLNKYQYWHETDKEQLSMPCAYGIGLAFEPVPRLVIDLDIYRTEWGDYEIIQADGSRINPITGYHRSKGRVKPTHQVRLGADYAFISGRPIIPTIRGGIFYDPAPAPGNPDDFFGASIGVGMTFREKTKPASRRNKKDKEREYFMSMDVAYQYRWGEKVQGEIIQGENSPANVDHHIIYLSIIYYFKGRK